MAGPLHDIILELLRREPATLAELLREHTALHLPPTATARPLDPNARQLRPVEFAADLVVRYAWRDRRATVIVEVQRRIDSEKLRTWPLYLTHVRTRTSSPVLLVVIATNVATADWARVPIRDALGQLQMRPIVLGPDEVPVLDERDATAAPALAMLSALVHLEHPDRVELAARAVRAMSRVDAAAAGLYLDVLIAELPAADGQQLLEVLMEGQRQPYYSWWGKQHFDEGKSEGKAEGLAVAVIDLLEIRGIELDASHRQRITSCESFDTLRTWLARAATADTARDVFGD